MTTVDTARAPVRSGSGAGRRFNVRWHTEWVDALDANLADLPDAPECPVELFRLLLQTPPAAADRRIAVVRDERGDTIAVVGLRKRLGMWESICDGVVPGALAPSKPGRLWDALESLALPIRINEWTGAIPPRARSQYRQTWHRISTRTDVDEFWRRSSNADTVRKARARCARAGEMTLEVDHADAAAWTIDGWARRWAGDPMYETALAGDLRTMTSYLLPRGRYHAFRLLHEGRPVAGLNAFVAGTTLVEQTSYRDAEYDKIGVGVRLDELFFRWAAESPYDAVVLGAGEYKARWAEPGGECVSFTICPTRVAVLTAARRLARSTVRLFQRPTY